jgi:hypothetical protein
MTSQLQPNALMISLTGSNIPVKLMAEAGANEWVESKSPLSSSCWLI